MYKRRSMRKVLLQEVKNLAENIQIFLSNRSIIYFNYCNLQLSVKTGVLVRM